MYVVKVPNRGSPPAILLRESYREAGKVKNRTLANLSAWPEAKVDALSRVLKGQPPPAADLDGAFEITRSLPHGHVAAVLGTARQLGLGRADRPGAVPAPGPGDRDGGRAGDRAGLQAGHRPRAPGGDRGQLPGRGPRAWAACDEDDLYAAMDYLHARQEQIQDALAARHLAGGTLVLYDVSSAAFEGRTCPLGAIGHPKDGVRGRLQIVYGLLTSPEGIPVAIEVFKGNTGDPATVAAQVTKVKDRFGISRVVLVGDRGMLTAARLREDVAPAGPGLDHRAARPAGQGAGPRRGPAADPVRYPGPGRDHLPGLPRRAAGGLQEPVPGSRARPQARKPAGRHRGRPGQDRRGLRAGPAAAARPGQDRRAGRQGPEPPQGRQALHRRHRRGSPPLPPRPGLHRRRGRPGRHLRAAHQRRGQ